MGHHLFIAEIISGNLNQSKLILALDLIYLLASQTFSSLNTGKVYTVSDSTFKISLLLAFNPIFPQILYIVASSSFLT